MTSMIKLVHQVRKAVRGARRELGFSLPLIRGKQQARVKAHGVAEKEAWCPRYFYCAAHV